MAKQTIYELERELENIKVEMADSNELQMAIESNKVAASQAISQNNKLKAELERLNEVIELQVSSCFSVIMKKVNEFHAFSSTE